MTIVSSREEVPSVESISVKVSDGNQKLFGPIPSASTLPDHWALSKPLRFANPAI